MPSLANCLRKSKLPAAVKSYLRAQARDGEAKQAIQDYLSIVEGNVKSLTDARKAALAAPQEEPTRAQAVPSPEAEVRQEQVRQDIRRPGEVQEGQEPTGQEPEAQVAQPQQAGVDGTTSARRAEIEHKRQERGSAALDSPSRRSQEESRRIAIERGIPEQAEDIAVEVIANARALDDVETIGLTIRARQLENETEELAAQISETQDEAEISDLSTKFNRARQKLDLIEEATTRSGSEQGRALASRKATVNRSFSLVSILGRAKASRGRSLTATQEKILTDLRTKLRAAENRADAAESNFSERRVSSGARRNKRGGGKNARDARIESLYADVGRLLRAGCHNN